MSKTNKTKYSFDTDYQFSILQFTVTDLQYGYKAIELFESYYFSLIEHSVIAEAIKKYYKKRSSSPSKVVLKEELRVMFKQKQWQSLLLEEDKERILKTVNKLYLRPVRDAEAIYDGCKKFAQYSALKNELENVDLSDFNSYENYHKKIHAAINKGSSLTEDKGIFILADAKSRTTKRQDIPPAFPTPFKQINKLLNNGGTSTGNVIVILGPAKRFKTGVLINLAKGYLKRGKVTLIADFENGQDAMGMRVDQSIVGRDRKEMLSGEADTHLLRIIRKYKRFGGELIVKRFNAGNTALTIKAYIRQIKEEYGLIVNNLICDYPDVMSDTLGNSDEVKRISQVYLDLKELGNSEKLDSIWCPSHVSREGDKKQHKRYHATDISKAIDKIRHADMILGMNQDESEKEAGVIRLELVDQRDGPQEGRAWFWLKADTQQMKEFTSSEITAAEEIRISSQSEDDSPRSFGRTKKEVSDV